jgi:hypothetical protein
MIVEVLDVLAEVPGSLHGETAANLYGYSGPAR